MAEKSKRFFKLVRKEAFQTITQKEQKELERLTVARQPRRTKDELVAERRRHRVRKALILILDALLEEIE